jgi:hypothetical protein
MKHAISIIISLSLTILVWASPVFAPGLELLFVPGALLLFCIGIAGLVAIPFSAYRFLQKKTSNDWLTWINGLAIGFYLGYVLLIPIDNWDEQQRNLSGQILAEKLHEYKISNGQFPNRLSQLNVDLINESLPSEYKIDRFNYFVRDTTFDLDIPIPILDRWHWNHTKKVFEYHDW